MEMIVCPHCGSLQHQTWARNYSASLATNPLLSPRRKQKHQLRWNPAQLHVA